MGRFLTDGKTAVLALIQQGYGPQNGIDKVFFTKVDQAVIFVKASDGSSPMMANLSNLAAWRANGTIPSDDELKDKVVTAIDVGLRAAPLQHDSAQS